MRRRGGRDDPVPRPFSTRREKGLGVWRAREKKPASGLADSGVHFRHDVIVEVSNVFAVVDLAALVADEIEVRKRLLILWAGGCLDDIPGSVGNGAGWQTRMRLGIVRAIWIDVLPCVSK